MRARIPLLCVAVLSAAMVAGCQRPPSDSLQPPDAAERLAGDLLVAEYGCAACHEAPAGMPAYAATPIAPMLANVGSRLRASGMRAFLSDPHAMRPGTRMPDLAGRLPSGGLDALTAFLAGMREGEGASPAPTGLDLVAIERGRQAYHELGCVACHAPFEDADTLERPLWDFDDLSGASSVDAVAEDDGPPPDRLALRKVARLYTFDGLVDFLADPLAVRPDGRMPDLDLSTREATDLAAYLWFEDAFDTGEVALDWREGIRWERFDGGFAHGELDALYEHLGDYEPAESGVTGDVGGLPPNPEEHFAFRMRGFVDVPETGVWIFSTESDDGSWLFVDGRMVVDLSEVLACRG